MGGAGKYVVGWLVVSVVALSVGLGTVAFVRDTVGSDTVVSSLSQAEVADQLSAATTDRPIVTGPGPSSSPTARVLPSPAATPAKPIVSPATSGPKATSTARARPRVNAHPTSGRPSFPSRSTRVLTSPGGSLIARCVFGGAVVLISWSPAQGYAVRWVDRGPGRDVGAKFEGQGHEYEVQVFCSGGVPVQRVSDGGGHGGSGSGGGGSGPPGAGGR